MYGTLVMIHSLLRWVVVVVSILAVVYALYGFLAKPPWQTLGDQLGSLFTWTVRINLLLGFVLWGGRFMAGLGFNVFFHVIHPLFMFVALALAEIMAARRRRQEDDAGRWRTFVIGTLVPTALIIAAIPW